MRRCLNVDDEAIISIAKGCPMMRELNIGGCSLVTDNGVLAIANGCHRLSCLNISHSKVSCGSRNILNIVIRIPKRYDN